MSRTIVDVHVLQTVPPSNLNRDDTGSPKSAMYGGVRRARVSSQAWKRATRTAFRDLLDPVELGVRSKRVVELVGEEVARQAPDLGERQEELAKAALVAAGITVKPARKKEVPEEAGYLLFLSHHQIVGLAELAVEAARAAGAGKPTVDKRVAKRRADQEHSVDVALFGRMVADDTDLNVDAAAQVAHAISVHAVQNEYDYFTAVDDYRRAESDDEIGDAGAGMIGTVEFNSSTLYRYATVDVDRLRDNLGNSVATARALRAFVRAFVMSMPTGKQNTFANRTLPDAVLVVVRETQSVNLVGAFEVAVDLRSGRVAEAVRILAKHAAEQHGAFDETPVAAWCVGGGEAVAPLGEIGEQVSMATLVEAVGATVAERSAGAP